MIDSRASSAAAQPTLSPAPSPERNDRLANLYPPSDICPYGEAPLVTTCRDTAKSVSFGFLRSRQGSELARNIISSNAFLYLPILAATACTSSVRAGSAACGAGRFRPSPPPGTCQTSPPKRTPSSSLYPYGGGEYIPWLTLSILLRCGVAKSGGVVYHILNTRGGCARAREDEIAGGERPCRGEIWERILPNGSKNCERERG